MKEQTLGEKRLKGEYNSAKNDLADQIKNKTAELIDLCEQLRNEKTSGEKHRLISISQTEYETACMYAVKACFTE